MSQPRIAVMPRSYIYESAFSAPGGDSFAGGADTSVMSVKAKAAKVDLVSDTNLSHTVKETAEKYTKLVTEHEALKQDLQAEVDSFLGLNMDFIKSTVIPFAAKFDFVKKAASGILSVVKKIDPVISAIGDVKGVLQNVSGDSLVEASVPAAAKKDHDDVVAALKNVDVKVDSIKSNLKEANTHAHKLEKMLSVEGANEDSFDFGGLFKTVLSVGGAVAKQFL